MHKLKSKLRKHISTIARQFERFTTKPKSLLVLTLFFAEASTLANATQFSNGVDVKFLNVQGNDIAFNQVRNELYVTVQSTVGYPNGNAIVSIDPFTGTELYSTFAGSEPTKIEVSRDGTRAYVGIDGARSFRSWTPGTNQFGSLLPIYSRYGSPAVAESFAIQPGAADVVVVSRDQVGSSADGHMESYKNGVSYGSIGEYHTSANQMEFVDSNTLITYNSSNTGFDLVRWRFDSNDLSVVREDSIDRLISGFSTRIEATGGLIYASNGMVVDPYTLTALGTFNTGIYNGAVESIADSGVTAFMGGESSYGGEATLKIFDNDTFLEMDSIYLGFALSNFETILELEFIGSNELAFLTSEGRVGLISAVPLPPAIFLFASALFALRYGKRLA